MLHLDPDLVRTDHIPVRGDTRLPAGVANVTDVRDGEFLGDRPTGVSDDASHGTAELGRQYLDAAATVVAAQIKEVAAAGCE